MWLIDLHPVLSLFGEGIKLVVIPEMFYQESTRAFSSPGNMKIVYFRVNDIGRFFTPPIM